ncbi:MAG: reprolysin-like metallopeptidase, partial [Bacteroidota bacterium]
MSYTRYMAIRLKARGSLIFTALLLGIQTLSAQERLWTDEDATFDVDRSRFAEDTRVLRANTDALHELLWSAPHERSISAAQSETIISIPYPDGSNHRFRIVGYDISEPDGLARYSHIRTWYGVGLDEPSRKVFLDWTERGFHAVVRGGQGPEMYIDPLSDGNMSLYRTYAAASALHPEHAFECRTLSEDHRPVHQGSGRSSTSTFGCELLQYRTAIACTDAYSNFYGAFDESQSGLVQSAVVTSVNRLNAIFTQELGLRLMLIANNDDLYFYSAADSPFTSNSLNDLFNQSIGVLDSAVGSSAFDIGHVYSSTPGGGSGVAFVASPCSFRKGQAVTIQSQGENADFLERIVAHEMGHQLGAGHTQNNNCFFDGISSVEPGSGSTIMSYSGICAPNVQPFPDQYFQGRSIKEIREFLNDPVLAGSACATLIDNGLNKPVLTPQTDERIPFGTPLVLKGEATGSESISYNWEQFDPGQAPMPPQGDSEVGPLFRSFPATDSPERFLPRLEDVLAGVDSDWEESPQVERFINFRLTVRHSNEMYGCTGEDEIRLTVDGNHGPFLVTDPANGNQWSDGQVAQVQWDVAGTDANGIDCQLVDIYISTDGGTTFTLLAEGEENDGLSEIVLPLGLTTTEARIMVRASDNVFYQVSPLDFSIVSNTGPVDISLSALTSTSQSSCFSIPEDELVFSLISSSQGGASLPLTPNLQGLPAGALVTFIPAFPRPGGSFQVLIYNMDQAAAGIYDLNLQMGSGEAADAISLELIKLDAATPPGPALVFPEDGATKIDIRPVLRVQDQGNTTYDFQLSTQPDFADLIMNKSAQPDSFLQVIPFLVGNTTYYWRARTQTNTA